MTNQYGSYGSVSPHPTTAKRCASTATSSACPSRRPISSPDGGRVTILEAGVATLELADPDYAAYIDEVEVGSRVAGHIRVAFEVDNTARVTGSLEDAGADVIAPPTHTPWNSLNARLSAPADLQVTIFAELDQP